MKQNGFNDHTYVEMRCIGDYADFVVYDPYVDLNAARITSFSIWMIPGTWRD